jgi:hypothetical protein
VAGVGEQTPCGVNVALERDRDAAFLRRKQPRRRRGWAGEMRKLSERRAARLIGTGCLSFLAVIIGRRAERVRASRHGSQGDETSDSDDRSVECE